VFVVWLAFGGVLGTLLRYAMMSLLPISSSITVGLVNFFGSLIIGGLFYFNQTTIYLFLAIGFCGAFTTFSSFSLEVVKLISDGAIFNALGYILIVNLLSIFGCFLGYFIARLLN
jgi:CrcB protein